MLLFRWAMMLLLIAAGVWKMRIGSHYPTSASRPWLRQHYIKNMALALVKYT